MSTGFRPPPKKCIRPRHRGSFFRRAPYHCEFEPNLRSGGRGGKTRRRRSLEVGRPPQNHRPWPIGTSQERRQQSMAFFRRGDRVSKPPAGRSACFHRVTAIRSCRGHIASFAANRPLPPIPLTGRIHTSPSLLIPRFESAADFESGTNSAGFIGRIAKRARYRRKVWVQFTVMPSRGGPTDLTTCHAYCGLHLTKTT